MNNSNCIHRNPQAQYKIIHRTLLFLHVGQVPHMSFEWMEYVTISEQSSVVQPGQSSFPPATKLLHSLPASVVGWDSGAGLKGLLSWVPVPSNYMNKELTNKKCCNSQRGRGLREYDLHRNMLPWQPTPTITQPTGKKYQQRLCVMISQFKRMQMGEVQHFSLTWQVTSMPQCPCTTMIGKEYFNLRVILLWMLVTQACVCYLDFRSYTYQCSQSGYAHARHFRISSAQKLFHNANAMFRSKMLQFDVFTRCS